MPTITIASKTIKSDKFESSNVRLPAAMKTLVGFNMVLDNADLTDPTFNLKLDAYVSEDNIIWNYYGGISYVGGVYIPQNQPGFVPWVDGFDLSRKYLKIKVELSRSASIGAEVTY